MADINEKMVLRTVYLPFDLDQELKSIAFTNDRSKGDLIRELIKAGIATAKKGGDKRFKVVNRADRIRAAEVASTAANPAPEARGAARARPGRALPAAVRPGP